MKSLVCPKLPTASVGSSQAPIAAVDNSAPSAIRLDSIYKSGKAVQTNGATSVLITIITVVFNRVMSLEQTILSVINQSYDNIEYIIIDGGSTDGTLDVIRVYESAIDYWISERDGGIYDAMNKAITVANGDWIYFLGADDILLNSETINRVVSNWPSGINADLIFGTIEYQDGFVFRSQLNVKINCFNTVHHQSAFYRKKLFDNFRYNENFVAVGDYELNYVIYRNKLTYFSIDEIIAKCGNGGLSHSSSGIRNYLDMFKIRVKHAGFFERIFHCFCLIVGLTNLLRRTILSKP